MANPILKLFAGLNAAVYRMSDGRIMGKMGSSDICVVRMQGARSGKWRDVPLMYVPNGAGVILVASLGGAPKHPVWYYNLLSYPEIELQDGPVRSRMRAREVHGEEKERWWQRAVAAFPDYAAYQRGTSRSIPVFVLEPLA